MKANIAKIKTLRSEAAKLEKQLKKGIYITTTIPSKLGRKVMLKISNCWLTFDMKGRFFPGTEDFNVDGACELSFWVESLCYDSLIFDRFFSDSEIADLIMTAKKKEFSAIDELLKTLTPEEFEAFTYTWDESGHCNAKDFMTQFKEQFYNND